MTTENEVFLSEVLGHVILAKGPVLISNEQWQDGLPPDALGVMVEQTQEGYLVFITDKEPEEEDDQAKPE